jgi:DNA-binding transcriptional LysR family regulator
MGIGPLHVAAALPGLQDGSLVRVLPEFYLQQLNIYALYASRQYVDAKIRSFVDFLYDRMPTMLADQDAALFACGNERLGTTD